MTNDSPERKYTGKGEFFVADITWCKEEWKINTTYVKFDLLKY